MEEKTVFKIHNIRIDNRKTFSVTGVKNVDSFSDKVIVLELSDERLIIEGEGINITNLDLDGGAMSADGKVIALKYAPTQGTKSFFKKFFK